MKNIIITVLLAAVSNSILWAEESQKPQEIKNKEALEIYEKYALKYYSGFWTGWGYTRNFDQKKYMSSGFGADPELLKILVNSPSSRSFVEAYQRENVAGHILYWGGLLAVIADIIFISTPGFGRTVSDQVIYWSLLGGGFTASVLGIGFLYSAQGNLQEGVWLYNKDLISGVTKVSQVNEPRFNLVFGGRF
jgi:hypothetical protein